VTSDYGAGETPDVFGIGSAVCPCGELRIGDVKGHRSITTTVWCPSCGAAVEVAPIDGSGTP
jgi:hypothetical protein